MRTQVFEHKGIIGIKSDFKAERLLNDPSQPNQIGFVVDAKFVDISPGALEILKTIPKSGDDIGDVDVFETVDNMIVFCWIGGQLKVINPKSNISGSSTYSPHLLIANDNVVTDPEFIIFIFFVKENHEIFSFVDEFHTVYILNL
jgi:hypothetical protein